MNEVAKFEKVSYEQFRKDCYWADVPIFGEDAIRKRWEGIQLPKRATAASAGYDFFMPFGFMAIDDNMGTLVPTGIRAKMEPGWCLMLLPRSGMGMRHGLRLKNTVGLIDSDYYFAENEGHIMVKLVSSDHFRIEQGERFIQGIFMQVGMTEDDDATGERTGGFGSTGK